MDIKEIMILVKGEDETENISTISPDSEKGKVNITYKNRNNSCPYNQKNVIIIKNPKVIELHGHAPYVDGMPIYNPQLILDFEQRIRIIQYNGESRTVIPQSFSLVKDGAANKNARQIQNYLKDISQYTSDNAEEGNFLKREMEQLTFVHPDSVLSYYLNQQLPEIRTPEADGIIFPFKFNLSQKAALENALKSSISIIEGPPGTGKTQTILNIIANLVAIQGKSVAVVSSNNEAIKNVAEKMDKEGYGFLTALLGKVDNQDAFFADMPKAKVEEWNCKEEKAELIQRIETLNIRLNQLLEIDRKRAQILQELLAWQLEQQHFEEYFVQQDIEEIAKLPLIKATPDRIISFLAETTLAKELNQPATLLYKLRLLFKYGIFDYRKLQQKELSILLSLQREFYRQQVLLLEREKAALENKLDKASFAELLDEHKQTSEKLFRKLLYPQYSELSEPGFTRKNFKVRFKEFIKRFPVILSTTHALRRSIPQNYILDYVIIDEASQVELITGALAFSSCRNVIIVGDMKQLPQITNKKIKSKLEKTTLPHSAFDYFENNILSSIIKLYGEKLPLQTLQEHYRCHPQIIEFCNNKYYDGKLIPYTSSSLSEYPLVLYKTAEGNHLRRVTRGAEKGLYNQRELDVTVEEIMKSPAFVEDYKNIGFVTPYRKQADKAERLLPDGIESDTIHKYQGREKDIMIMSTVLDNTRDGQIGLKFVDDPRMVNVAVSRAIKQFILVTDHNLFFERGKDVSDLIRYIQYSTLDENVIESEIVSVFDLLYRRYSSKLIPLKSKMDTSERFQSEEALRVLLEEILAEPEYKRYSYVRGMLMRNLLKNVDLLNTEELNFVNHRASLDFVVHYKQDKACAFVIEVDGFAYHENNPEQLHRDALKNAILTKYGVAILRLATNGSNERKRIEDFLKE